MFKLDDHVRIPRMNTVGIVVKASTIPGYWVVRLKLSQLNVAFPAKDLEKIGV